MSAPGTRHHELVAHTGDMAIVVRAGSLAELYDEAAAALCDVLVDVRTVTASDQVPIDVSGAVDAEDLFVRFLSELLFLHDARDWLLCGFRTEQRGERAVSGYASGERFDPSRHAILRQVKAVTYHHLQLAEDSAGWTARVVLDL